MKNFNIPIIAGTELTVTIENGMLIREYKPITDNNMKHRLIGKTVECRDFPGETFIIEDYDPETGWMEIRGGTETYSVHVSKCRVVVEQEV